MKLKSNQPKASAEQVVKDIRRATRRHYSTEDKIRIVLSGLRGEDSIAELCRKEGIAQGLYYSWSKEFLEAGKKRLAGDTARAATSDEVRSMLSDPSVEGGGGGLDAGEPVAQKKHDRGWGREGMRYAADEKLEIIRLVESSHLGVKRTIERLGVARPTFYRWYARYQTRGEAGLNNHYRGPARPWNRLPEEIRAKLVELALEVPELSPRELAVHFTHAQGYYVSESTVYRLLKSHDLITSPAFVVIKAANEFKDKTTGVNQLWQTDFTYFKVMGWGWFYLSTILDDYSRYIIAWRLCTTMQAADVTQTLEVALRVSECQSARVEHKPLLLSDNGPCYISQELALWLKGQGMRHVRGAPNHPQTQGKIERWHQSLKNCVLLEHYYLPGELEQSVDEFVAYYNHKRYHESLSNLTPADVYFGRGESILEERRRIKEQTIQSRRLKHQLETV